MDGRIDARCGKVNDDTEKGIDALTGKIKDPEERRAAAGLLRRNSVVSRIILWLMISISTGVVGGVAAEFAGVINIVK